MQRAAAVVVAAADEVMPKVTGSDLSQADYDRSGKQEKSLRPNKAKTCSIISQSNS